jgi:hypothetical protein
MTGFSIGVFVPNQGAAETQNTWKRRCCAIWQQFCRRQPDAPLNIDARASAWREGLLRHPTCASLAYIVFVAQ